MLKGLIHKLPDKGLGVYIADLHAPVREFAHRVGLLDLLGEEYMFLIVDLAVGFFEKTQQAQREALSG